MIAERKLVAPLPRDESRARGHFVASRHTPAISPFLLRWFTWYSRHYVKRHFHSLRVSRTGLPPDTQGLPLLLYSNHASWWDPLVCLLLKQQFFPERNGYAPIDAAMLEKYSFFRHLGFFGIDPHSARGAAQFLRTAEELLQSENNLVAVTPHGRFADARERPVRLKPGLAHLARRVERTLFLPLAIEYVFWDERLPEILVRFGKPIRAEHEERSAEDLMQLFNGHLARAQDALALESQRRDPAQFQTLVQGGAGQGGVYDWWRWMKGIILNKPFRKEHGNHEP
ncbi:MAG: lysophospholipid acyltransferase family protein [Verrucomicrobiota bacterium]|nr:lysophospholipid acyltransferase family protein [Verrucomicrobiota bacterium]